MKTQSRQRATIGGMTVNIEVPRPRGVSAPKPVYAIEATGLEKTYPATRAFRTYQRSI